MSMTPYLSIEGVAELLDVHADTVRAWVSAGELKAYNASENARSRKPRFRIAAGDLQTFLDARCNVKTTPAPTATPRRRRAGSQVTYY